MSVMRASNALVIKRRRHYNRNGGVKMWPPAPKRCDHSEAQSYVSFASLTPETVARMCEMLWNCVLGVITSQIKSEMSVTCVSASTSTLGRLLGVTSRLLIILQCETKSLTHKCLWCSSLCLKCFLFFLFFFLLKVFKKAVPCIRII